MLSANARVFQTLVIAIIAMFMISRSEIITFAEEFLKKTLSLLLDFNIFKRIALKYIKIVFLINYLKK